MKDLTFFLGANTCRGFCSLYQSYLEAYPQERVWILKGGAGCGKSGFMRRVAAVAAEAGFTVHRILCSGDPSSLDGIHVPELHALLFDGTAPHVLEPPLVGDRGFYLDLSQFYRPGVPDLQEREAAYREHYRRAYQWLGAAGSAEASLALPAEAGSALRRKAGALMARELRRRPGTADSRSSFFVEAFTGDGLLSLPDTCRALASRLIGLQGVCGAEHVFLSAAADAAAARGWNTVICPDPLQPDRIAHLFIPERELGIGVGTGDRVIHLDRIVYKAAGREESARIRDTAAMRSALAAKARRELQLARHFHDKLEEAVNPFVDFAGVYELAERFAGALLESAPPA